MTAPHETSSGLRTELDRIYSDPDTHRALDLCERFATQSLKSQASLTEFLDSLPPESKLERAKLEQILADPAARVEADISTRAGQLVWAAGLGFAFQSGTPGTIRSSALWKMLTRNPRLSGSLGAAARYLDLSITNRDATMDWGTPGSWFWFAPEENHINIDLFHTLLCGFGPDPAPGLKGIANMIGLMMHEVGHSQLTVRFTNAMMALKDRQDKLMAESKTRKLTRDEFKELTRIRKEFELRMNMMNPAEDNCVNRYAANQTFDLPYDISHALNIDMVTSQGFGLILKNAQRSEKPPELAADPKQMKVAQAREALDKLRRVVGLAFYTTNGLFHISDVETWKRLGVDPAQIKGADNAAFDDLMKMCIGPDGMANLQPTARDRWLLRSIFSRSVQSYADRRCALIDRMWDSYAAPHAKILIDAAEDAAEKKMNQKADGQKNGKGQGKGQGQGQGQGKDLGQGEGSGEQQGQPQSGQGGGGSRQSQGNRGDDPSPSQGGSGGQSGGEDKPSGGLGSVEVEGVGEMEFDGAIPATPEEARKANRKGSEDDITPDTAKTVRDLARDAKEAQRKDAAGNDKEKETPGGARGGDDTPDALGSDPGPGGKIGQRKVDLTQLSSGDWREFRKRINELEPVISRVADDFAYIRDRQSQPVRGLSRQNEQLPRGGDVRERLDMRAHMNLSAKRATGQKIEPADLQRWRKDQIETEPTSVELWILGDGSGSTRHSMSDGGRRIDSCLQTMAILYKAGERAGFDVHAGVWENHGVHMLAEPGYSDRKIGENFEAVKQSGGCGTIYNTPIPQIVERLANQTTDAAGRPRRFAGMTHFLWVLDGTENDLDVRKTADMLIKLFRHGPAVSLDIAYMGGYSNCETKQIVALVKQAMPSAPIDTLEALDAKDAPVRLVRQIKRRFEQSSNGARAIPDRVKREKFASACKVMRL